MKYAIRIYFWCHFLTSLDFLTRESTPSLPRQFFKGRFQACNFTSGSCPRFERQPRLWDANRQQRWVLEPIGLFALIWQHNLHKGKFDHNFEFRVICLLQKETWIFSWHLFLCLRLSMSSGYLTCSPCQSSGVMRTDAISTYAIPNSFLAQAMIKRRMSWHIIQLGFEEPGWKLGSLHCMAHYDLFAWCTCSQAKLKDEHSDVLVQHSL